MELNRQKVGLAAAVIGSVAAAVVLFFFAPTEHPFYPRCVFHSLTGLACPGCGSLRAVHSFLNGEFAAAFRLNPLLLTVLPVAGIVFAVRRALGLAPARPAWVWLLLSIIVSFSVLRNLPIAPFDYFRP